LLCQAGRRLGLEMRVLAERPTDPAVRFADVFREGSTDDEESVVRFASDCDLLLFENEFVPKPVLEALEPLGARVQPAPPVIGEIQNKLRQKRHFREAGLPTSPFVEREDGETASAFVERARRLLEDRVVLKWAELGYDGKGTCVASSPAEALAFAEDALARGRPLYAEQRVDFVREVALVASRSLRGDLVTWPLVVTRQERGVCREVYGPARLFGVGEVAERELNFWAERTGEKFRLVGTFALEIFEDREGRFWMNELAPRVHNSGHWRAQLRALEPRWRRHEPIRKSPARLPRLAARPRGIALSCLRHAQHPGARRGVARRAAAAPARRGRGGFALLVRQGRGASRP